MSVVAHQPPAVRYPFAPSRLVAALTMGLVVLGMLVLSFWLLSQRASTLQVLCAVLLSMGGALAAWQWLHHAPKGVLTWDGAQWWFAEDANDALDQARAGAPCVCADFQSMLLVRVRRQGVGVTWLWLERHTRPDAWLDLRRALFARVQGRPHPESALAHPIPGGLS